MDKGDSYLLGAEASQSSAVPAKLPKPHWQLPQALRTLLGDRLMLFGTLILLMVIIAAIWPISLLPHDPYTADISLRFVPPAWEENGKPEYLLGTDALGRDNVSMIIHGARFSLLIISFSVLLSLMIGVMAGLIAGYNRGWVDELLMRLVDIQLAFPVLVLIIAVVAVLGPNFRNLVLVLGVTGWAPYARIVRGTVLALREKEFIEAAEAVGGRGLHIIIRHLLPNTVTPVVIFTSFELARLLLLESALSFLGLGVQPPTPSWGAMIADGRQYLFEAWWASALPGLAIVATVLAFNLLGDGLRDILDPLTRER
jgi:ABC-type dipeptide/oligopeptide/nickel transport system permease subunit